MSFQEEEEGRGHTISAPPPKKTQKPHRNLSKQLAAAKFVLGTPRGGVLDRGSPAFEPWIQGGIGRGRDNQTPFDISGVAQGSPNPFCGTYSGRAFLHLLLLLYGGWSVRVIVDVVLRRKKT